jgi:hypothetical protein
LNPLPLFLFCFVLFCFVFLTHLSIYKKKKALSLFDKSFSDSVLHYLSHPYRLSTPFLCLLLSPTSPYLTSAFRLFLLVPSSQRRGREGGDKKKKKPSRKSRKKGNPTFGQVVFRPLLRLPVDLLDPPYLLPSIFFSFFINNFFL